MVDSQHDEWVKYPVGKLGKGAWCDHCKRYSVRNSTCSVIGIKDGAVLMHLRGKNPQKGFWSLPGGYVEWDETLEDCARREIEEDAGYQVNDLRFFKVYSDPKRDLDGRQNIEHIYVGEIGAQVEAKLDKSQALEQRFFPLDKLPEKIAFDHKEVLADYQRESTKGRQ